MTRTISNKIMTAITAIIFAGLVAFPTLVQAATSTSGTYDFKSQSGLGTAAGVAGYETGASATSLETVISTIVYIILGFVGLIFFGLVIMGAFTWMTAEGNEEKVKKANGMVMNALFGLIVTLSAYAVSYFLISYFW